jgi:hypothetical protein
LEGILETLTVKKSIILAKEVRALKDALEIKTDDGVFQIPWEDCSPKLANASEMERLAFEKSPSGYGIHWFMLDEDLAVGPLVQGRRKLAYEI